MTGLHVAVGSLLVGLCLIPALASSATPPTTTTPTTTTTSTTTPTTQATPKSSRTIATTTKAAASPTAPASQETAPTSHGASTSPGTTTTTAAPSQTSPNSTSKPNANSTSENPPAQPSSTNSASATTPTSSSTPTPSPTPTPTPTPATPEGSTVTTPKSNASSEAPSQGTTPQPDMSTSSNTHSPTPNGTNSSTASSTTATGSTTTTTSTTASPTHSSTTKPSSVKPSTDRPTSTAAPQEGTVLINEFTFTGLFSGGSKLFVELKRQGSLSKKVTVVVLDGSNLQCVAVQPVTSNWTSDLAVVDVNQTQSETRQSMVVALYNTETWASCDDYNVSVTNTLVDLMILGKKPDVVDSKQITETFSLPRGSFNVLIADEGKLKLLKGSYSVSRCGDGALNIESFIVTMETKGTGNNCSLPQSDTVNMSFNADSGINCDDLKNETTQDFVKNYIAKNVGDSCACGLSPFLISFKKAECKVMTMGWVIDVLNEDQRHLVNTSFYSTLQEDTCLRNGTMCLTKPCKKDCGHLPNKDNGKGNISVTVAVVITCIVVFLIIVIIVIIYIKRKRRGILQFRMTRLNDDDDDLIGQDTDDFVGSGDASFSGPV